ncbi:hypothetical protein FOL47_005943, partial [Perkinsus chesapeaki]
TYDLESDLHHKEVNEQGTVIEVEPRIFADDILAIVRAADASLLSAGLAGCTEIINRWATRAELSTDPAKHEILCLTTDAELALKSLLSDTAPEEIEHVKESIKWLGVTISRNWKPQAVRALAKAKAVAAKCRRICGLGWGIQPQ